MKLLQKYSNLNIPNTEVNTIKIDENDYCNFVVQQEVPGKIFRVQFDTSVSISGDPQYEEHLYQQVVNSHSDSAVNLKLLADDLVSMLNSDHFLPDLNYGLLSTDNILFDKETGKFSLVDIDDCFELPSIFLDQLSSGEKIILDNGDVNEKLVTFIKDNEQYDEPYMGRLADWLVSIGNVLRKQVSNSS